MWLGSRLGELVQRIPLLSGWALIKKNERIPPAFALCLIQALNGLNDPLGYKDPLFTWALLSWVGPSERLVV